MSDGNMALAVRSTQELTALGAVFESSGMFGCTQAGQGTVLAMTCVMTGMSPMQVNQTYHIIEGKLSMRADAMLAKFSERGGKYKITERSKDRAAAVFVKGDNNLEAEYTMADARESGICFTKDGKTLKTNWSQHPKQMLWARLISDTVRALDPGVNMGMYTPEEVQDFDPAPASTRVQSRKASEPPAPMAAPADAPKPEPVTPEVMDTDPGCMPVGRLKGKPWAEFTAQQLVKVINTDHPAITDAHKQAAETELAKRNDKED